MKLTSLILFLAGLLCATAPSHGQSVNGLSLEVLPPNEQGWIRLNTAGQPGRHTLEASTNLVDWSWIATLHDGIHGYPDPASARHPARYYRVESSPRNAGDDWKNQIHISNDEFLTQFSGQLGLDFRWIKFSIPLEDPVRVYYQNSQVYDFHFEFARARLEPFRHMTPAQFEQVALRTNHQQVLLGTVLIPPSSHIHEYGIQFVGADPYPPEFIGRFFDLVQSTIVADPSARGFYVPAFEQTTAAESNQAYFESRGIPLASSERWIAGDHAYAIGWALGRLKFFPSTEIDAAFFDGRLKPEDILLTDGVPAEIPILAGVLTMRPSTPNSHVAILARSYGVPFAYLADPLERVRVQSLSGKEILLRVEPYDGVVKIFEVATELEPALRADILSLKKPPELQIAPKARFGAYTAPTDNLTPADIQFFGGKASNFGFLRRTIPERSQDAIGISFDLWDEFLDQVMPGGKTLRALIDERLSKYSYPPNMASLKVDLETIQALITGQAQFSDAQKNAIIAGLDRFDPLRKIRFRSSTNVEDSEQFTGAGLYDSYSGCLQDDLDGDNEGPSHCDPAHAKERGVFRAIQKVYASFYNHNAFIERLRHGVDENTAGMALLVHHSAPDEIEMANGVAVLQAERGGGSLGDGEGNHDDSGPDRPIRTDSLGGPDDPFEPIKPVEPIDPTEPIRPPPGPGGKGGNYNNTADLVTQKGAVSVTNPDGTARPEVAMGYLHPFGAGVFLVQRSNLVPLGAHVLEWEKDYNELMTLFASVADAYHEYFPHKNRFLLDFEYKKLQPGILDVKQVREIPVPHGTNNHDTFLLNTANEYWVYQGEAADVFSNHRLKSFWSFQTRNLKLTDPNLAGNFYVNMDIELLENSEPARLSGSPATFPQARDSQKEHLIMQGWTLGAGSDQRDYELQTAIRTKVGPNESPVLNLSDLRLTFTVDFATPQPALEFSFEGPIPVMVNQHSVVLEPRRMLISTNHLQERTFPAGAVSVQTSFYWPKPPGRGIGDKTAPLVQWKETRIAGLTSEPITLRGDYAQTYRPGHHNFTEEFIFEPALEEGLAPSVLQELQAANVKLIYIQGEGLFGSPDEPPVMMILGIDGNFRTISAGN
jgi:hypothetical protein